jgi:hypothetical protein
MSSLRNESQAQTLSHAAEVGSRAVPRVAPEATVDHHRHRNVVGAVGEKELAELAPVFAVTVEAALDARDTLI